jgi:hypothetical protein
MPTISHVGMWVVVTAWEVEEESGFFGEGGSRRVMRPLPVRFIDGREPMQVRAVSLPFIAVQGVFGEAKLEIWDFRLLELAEANAGLVRACKTEARRRLSRASSNIRLPGSVL